MTAALQDRDAKRKVNEEADMEKSEKKMNCPQLTCLILSLHDQYFFKIPQTAYFPKLKTQCICIKKELKSSFERLGSCFSLDLF